MSNYARAPRRLGQNFLVNTAVAEAEAEHGRGKRVLEIGPGHGILTRELCKMAERVVAVELDRNLFLALKDSLLDNKLKLINKDFFDASEEELELNDIDIVIANIPYSASSSVIDFLMEHRLQAVLCLQKEFVEHMTAKAGTRNYSRLSVMFQLCFTYTKLMKVGRGSFRPVPKVDSEIIYAKSRDRSVGTEEKGVINAIMQHKKKTVKNAILGSSQYLGSIGCDAKKLSGNVEEKDARVFTLEPESVLGLARKILKERNRAPGPARV